METAGTVLGNLNAMGVMDSRASGVKLPHSITKDEVDPVTLMNSKVTSAIWHVQTYDID